ncbi:hypothetical protein ABT061_38455 [Streptosporangium sp. NPDC002544]
MLLNLGMPANLAVWTTPGGNLIPVSVLHRRVAELAVGYQAAP